MMFVSNFFNMFMYNVPINTMINSVNISIKTFKPICLDYWKDSKDKNMFIGVNKYDKEYKILAKNEEEYTSKIVKIYKTSKEYIIETEFSVFIVKNEIPNKYYYIENENL